MERLNYQHLYYFWIVAKTGSIKAACETLGLAQPTISGQLALFQKAIEMNVFRREGRKLTLTESGWRIFNYADEIFNIGDELNGWLKGRTVERRRDLTVGLCGNVDMLAALQLLAPVWETPGAPQLRCFVGDAERLALDLRLRTFDLAMLPAPPSSASAGAHFIHLLASLGISAFAPAHVADDLRADFPRSLQGASMVLPFRGSPLRQSLDVWLHARSIGPAVKAEIEDSELAKSVAASGGGLVFAPTTTQAEMRRRYGLEAVGVVEGVEERIYAALNHHKIRDPVVARILGIGSP